DPEVLGFVDVGIVCPTKRKPRAAERAARKCGLVNNNLSSPSALATERPNERLALIGVGQGGGIAVLRRSPKQRRNKRRHPQITIHRNPPIPGWPGGGAG